MPPAKHRWVTDKGKAVARNPEAMLMRVAAKAGEAERAARKDLIDENLPDRKMAEVCMADLVITALDFAAGFQHEVSDLLINPIIIVQESGEEKEFDFAGNLPDDQFAALLFINRVVMTLVSANAEGEFNAGHMIGMVVAYCDAWCRKFGHDLWGAIDAKMAFNEAQIAK
jgi:hypothetical protein